MRRSIFLLTLLSLLLWGVPARADFLPVRAGASQQNGCAEQVFRGTTLQVTLDYGATYQPASPMAAFAMRTVYACPITSPVMLGQRYPIGVMADQVVMVVYASLDGKTFYVHREWRVYALSAAQWSKVFAVVNLKAAH